MPFAFTAHAAGATGDTVFPLSVAGNGRYLQDRSGRPFFIHGDSGWCSEVQLTRSQILRYLDNRKRKGFNAIIIEAFEHFFSSQSPAYQNAEGNNPFTTMSPLNFSTANPAYWTLVDYLVIELKRRNMLLYLTSCYYGFNSTEGWQDEMTADTSAHLQAYGAFLMARYGHHGNIVWVMGGDSASGASLDTQIVTGMRSVRTDFRLTGHSVRGSDGYSKYSAQTGFDVNSQYSSNTNMVSDAATCYGRAMPFVLIEGYYEGEHSMSRKAVRLQSYQTFCSGACGYFFGNNPIWVFGGANNTFNDAAVGTIGAQAALDGYLDSNGALDQAIFQALVDAVSWWKLVPKTDTSLVTTSLGTGTSAIAGAVASDGTFALITTPSGGFTVDMTNITHSSVRARWFDPVSGAYTADGASPLTNTGTHAFTSPGNNSGGDTDWTLVLD